MSVPCTNVECVDTAFECCTGTPTCFDVTYELGCGQYDWVVKNMYATTSLTGKGDALVLLGVPFDD